VVQNIRRRVIRTLRRLGYLEAGMDVPWPLGMIRFSTPNQSLPAPWRLRSSRVSPLAHGLESKCAASARALALQANGLHS
jgi:hypothetical protein